MKEKEISSPKSKPTSPLKKSKYYNLPRIPFRLFWTFRQTIEYESIQNVYHKVMSRLKPSQIEMEKLDFYSRDFVKNLYSFMKNMKISKKKFVLVFFRKTLV